MIEIKGEQPQRQEFGHIPEQYVEACSFLFGLPKPDTRVTSAENMPTRFSLPREMMAAFKEIMGYPDSDRVEYNVPGEIKNGRLVLGKPNRVEPFPQGFLPQFKEQWRINTGRAFTRKRVAIRSHPQVRGSRLEFSVEEIAHFLVGSAIIFPVVRKDAENPRKYEVLIVIKGQKTWATGRDIDRTYQERYYQILQKWVPVDTTASLQRNGCGLYFGKGSIDQGDMVVQKMHPVTSLTEFEKDPRTGLMLPK